MASVEGVRRLEFDWVPIFEKRSRTDESYFRDEIFSGFRFLITGDVLKIRVWNRFFISTRFLRQVSGINYLFGDTETGSSIFSCLIEDAVMSTTSSVDPEVRGALIGWTVVWFWLVDSVSAVFISTTVDDCEIPAADWSSLCVSLIDPVVDISLAWRNSCWCCSSYLLKITPFTLDEFYFRWLDKRLWR